MGRPKKEQPAPGGAVREPIKEMLAPGSEDSFKESLPEQTSSDDSTSPAEDRPRRKRRTKEEIAAAKGEGPQAPVDKRLEKAQNKMVGLGAASLIESGFKIAGKPLDSEEKEDLDDQFYLIARKSGASADNWIFIILYTVALILRLVLSRTELGDQLRNLFLPKEENAKKKKKKQAPKPKYDDRDDPNHGDGLNDLERSLQSAFCDNDSMGGETGRYLDMMGEE